MAIEVTYENNVYRFGFTRESAQAAERDGFVASSVAEKPTLMIPILVYHAATAYNKGIRRKTVESIYDEMQDKDGFLAALMEEYAEPVTSLFESKEQGNAIWKRV